MIRCLTRVWSAKRVRTRQACARAVHAAARQVRDAATENNCVEADEPDEGDRACTRLDQQQNSENDRKQARKDQGPLIADDMA